MSLQEAPDSPSHLSRTLGFYFNYLMLEVPKGVQTLYHTCARQLLCSCVVRPQTPSPRNKCPMKGAEGRTDAPAPCPFVIWQGARAHGQSSPQGPHPIVAICLSQCPWLHCFEGQPLHPFTPPVPLSCWTQAMGVFSVRSPQWPVQKPKA